MKAHERYGLPREIEADGRSLLLRLMGPEDEEPILAFARALPEHDLLFMRRDITQPKVVAAWIREIAAGGYVSVVAVLDGRIVGCATVVRDPLSWSAHVEELRVVLLEEVRGAGLGTELVQQAFTMALSGGAEKVFAQMTADQRGAVAMFEALGFGPEAMLRDHVKDRVGKTHDVLVLSHHVARFQSTMAAYGLPEAF